MILLLPTVSVFATDEDKIQDLNNLIALRADQWSTITSPIVVVDHYTGFDVYLHTSDGVHPNRLGDKKMADTWTDALLSLKIDADNTINILLLGDSITDGGYRFDLWRNLQSEEINFDFIGTKHNYQDPNQFLVANGTWGTVMSEVIIASDEEIIQFDQDHDAVGGIRSDDLVERGALQNYKVFRDSLLKPDMGLSDLPADRQPVCSESVCDADGTCKPVDVPCVGEQWIEHMRSLASSWLQRNNPDVALIHIGTNDLIQGKTPEHVVVHIERMVSILRNQNPNVNILVAQIIPFDYCARENFPSCVKMTEETQKIMEEYYIPSACVSNPEDTCHALPILRSYGAVPESELPEPPVKSYEYESPEPPSGGCLIATAAFGSEMAPQVQFLRELRDNIVLQTESGTNFMTGFNQFYYSFSPAIADYERENPTFKEAVKLTLTPLLTSLTLLQYADIDSESEMLGYGIGVILLNIGIYFVAPAVLIIMALRKVKATI